MTAMTTTDEKLRSIYYTPKSDGSFTGVKNLHRAARKLDESITEQETKEWLQKELTYSLHYPARKHFQRNKIVSNSPFELVQMDLCDMTEYAGSNSNYKYIITVIDVFTKMAFAKALKNKEAETVRDAVEVILSKIKPHMVQTDLGTEFKNKTVLKVLKDNGIHLYFARNKQIKASVVERFNRTLKEKMHRYFTSKGTRRYTNVLSQLVDSYNNTHHSAIGMKPVEAVLADPNLVFRKLYGIKSNREMEMSAAVVEKLLVIGSHVRVRYITSPMDKGYLPKYSDVIYRISKHVKGFPRMMYQVKDHEGQILQRKLYREDLQPVPSDTRYRVERILRRRKRPDGSFDVRVKWLNYPSSANSWVPEEEIGDVF